MAAESVAAPGASRPVMPRRPFGAKDWSRRRTAILAILVGLIAAAATLSALLYYSPRPVPRSTASATLPEGAPWPSPGPMIRSAEMWFATAPAPGVWAELQVILDNPLPEGPTRTMLLVSGTILEDFRILSTEPKLVTQPRRRPDGRYALVFPAPIPESHNWYRIYLECRNAAPRPVALGLMLDGVGNQAERPPVPAQIFHVDRQADPFMVVPESLVRWVPGSPQSAFPILVLLSMLVGGVAAAGCVAVFWVVRR